MGISGKPELLINQTKLLSQPIPVIKRFSGGGTVVVDEETIFVTFILNKEHLNIPLQPEVIMKWTEGFYKNVFPQNFTLRENDYVFHEKKFGGNAQYIRKNRLLHHTSFLWDFTKENMDYLLLPSKAPNYRNRREHDEFLCKLKNHLPSKDFFIDKIISTLSTLSKINLIKKEEVIHLLEQPHRKATQIR